jgi:hypothetical protein
MLGDTLEIRAVIAVASGDTLSTLRYREIIPAGVVYIPNTIRAITNEGAFGGGITNTGVYTDAASDDPGTLVTGNTVIVNLGQGAGNGTSSASGGAIYGGITRPTFYGVQTIIQAAYRVRVTAATFTNITVAGTFFYRNIVNGVGTNLINNLPNRSIRVLPNANCAVVGNTNLITDESGGTFSSGTAHDRGASPNAIGFTYSGVTSGSPQDGQYSVAKNTSPTQYTGGAPVAGDRVFTVWDILGDHTGTSDNFGNPPSASGATGGYMLAVNATYAPSSIFSTNITGLLPNTEYTMRFWVRNICPLCGANPMGGGSGTPGVKPNLAFDVNGVDYYTTGEMTYTGLWDQQSFTFNTGALTSANVTIRNNAPGGGGNDWVLDDISLSACLFLLPVKLTKFQGREADGRIYLDWEIGSGSTPSHFEVDYADDGRNFRSVGKVDAESHKTSYSFEEPRSGASVKYYRLQMVDMQGKAQYSQVLVIRSQNGSGNQYRLTPNPASSQAYLQVDMKQDGVAQIRISDFSGKVLTVFQENLRRGQNQVSLLRGNQLAQGMYIVQVSTGQDTWQDKLIIR